MSDGERGAAGGFVFATWEGGGHVTPALWAARRLADRGHRVLVLSDEASRPEAAALGLSFRAWRRAPNRVDKSLAQDPIRDFEPLQPAELIARLCERLIVGPAEAYARDLVEVLDARPGAVVVGQELLFGVMLGAEAAGASLALLTANIWPFPTLEGAPPFGLGLIPPDDEVQRLQQPLIAAAGRAFYDLQLPGLNAARAALGLGPLDHLLDQTAVADRVLVGTARAFDFAPPVLPTPFVYAGPQVRAPGWAAAWRSRWENTDPRPLVLVSFSTLYQGQEPVIARVVEAFIGLHARALVTLGPQIPAGGFIELPENVMVVESASHDAVMPHVSLIVTHAGHGTAVRPLLHGVPVLAMPMGRDQFDNAARIAARGAGLTLDAHAGVEIIQAAIVRLLTETSFANAAHTLGAAIAAEVEAAGDVVVRELETLTALNPRPATRPLRAFIG